MKNVWFKKAMPHLIAIGIFLAATLIFCRPALQRGVAMRQGDMTSVQGMIKQLKDHYATTGHYPMWVTGMFSGMPAWQVLFDGGTLVSGYIGKVFQLWLPEPFSFFFLACISFYIFCMCLRIRPWVAVLGSLAFAYSSYNPIIVTEGHITKMLAMAYAPALLGGVILLYEKKYLTGFALTALFASLQIQQNHPQITYYVLLVIAVMSVFYLARWIREKLYGNIAPAFGLAALAVALGVLVNAVLYLPVYDYTAHSKRGGQLVMNENTGIDTKTNVVKDNKTVGLTKEYAFQWSYGIGETFTLLFPGAKGYGLTFAQKDGEQYLYPQLDGASHIAKTLEQKLGAPEAQAENFAMQMSQSLYWGDQPFTRGPVYLGAIVCFLFIFSLFYLDGKHKWWLLAASLLGIFLSWGKFFPAFNNFIFDYLPYYNKLRVPTLALFIPQLLFPVGAVLALNKLIDGDKTIALAKFKSSLMATASLIAVAGLVYLMSDFGNENKQRTQQFNQLVSRQNDPGFEAGYRQLNQTYAPMADNQVYENLVFETGGNTEAARDVLNALHKDRQSAYGSSLFRSIIFIVLAVALLWLFLRGTVKPGFLLTGLIVLMLIDLMGFGSHYLNQYNFDSKENFETDEFPITAADRQILQDKDPNYRVLNTTAGDPYQDSRTSYYHKSVGGYHAAKLGIYDDLITYQLSGKSNMPVLNMLNTKYIIGKAQPDSTQPKAANRPTAQLNPGALGNAWFVKGVHWVQGPVAEMKALDYFNPKDTAIVDESFKQAAGEFTPADSADVIRQTAFDNDSIRYESNSSAPHLAVFSEMYYKDWNAYIDGKKADIIKANYVLRALNIPAGKHTIDFRFEPKVFFVSKTISQVFNWVLVLVLLVSAFFWYRKTLVKAA